MPAYQSHQLSVTTGVVLLIIFGAIWVALGLYWGRKAKNLEGFMLAGRNVGLALGSATAMATWVTSNTIMLAPMFALMYGVWGLLAYATASFGLFLFAPMAFRIRRLMPSAYTSGDFMRLRYGRVAWVMFLIISIIYSMAWLVSMGMAGGYMLQALSGLDYRIGMSVILLVCVLYTLFGGLYAVIGTDFIQSVIILIGVVVVGFCVLSQIEMETVYTTLETEQPMLLTVFMPVALLTLFNNMFFGFGEVFHNNVWWSRAFAMREGVPFKAFMLSGLFWLPIPVAAGFIGLCAAPLGINVTQVDMVGPLVASQLLGWGGSILVFVVVFCSLASSIDSLLAATADLVAEDVVHKWILPDADEPKLRQLSTYIVIGLGLVTWGFCMLEMDNLMKILFWAGPLVASAIFPVLFGLYWNKPGEPAAVLAMAFGSATGYLVYYTVGVYAATLVSAFISLLTISVISFVLPEKFDWKRLNEHPSPAVPEPKAS